MAKKDGTGRYAIEWIKARYDEGRSFVSSADLRDAIVAAGIAPRATMALASGWDLQARYELANDMVYVTQPRGINGRLRNPNATPIRREDAQQSAQRELARRASNQAVYAKAAAAQFDATPNEIRKATQIEIAASILADVATPAD